MHIKVVGVMEPKIIEPDIKNELKSRHIHIYHDLMKEFKDLSESINRIRSRHKFINYFFGLQNLFINKAFQVSRDLCYGCLTGDDRYHYMCSNSLEHFLIRPYLIQYRESFKKNLITSIDNVNIFKPEVKKIRYELLQPFKEVETIYIVNDNFLSTKDLTFEQLKTVSESVIGTTISIDSFQFMECIICESLNTCNTSKLINSNTICNFTLRLNVEDQIHEIIYEISSRL